MTARDDEAPSADQLSTSLRTPTLLWSLTLAILLLSIYFVIQNLAHANRPHELHSAPWVAVLMLLSFGVCVKVLVSLRRIQRAHRSGADNGKPGPAFWALAIASVLTSCLTIFLFLTAASSVPAVLGWW